MALDILTVMHRGELWVITMKVREGVYKKDEYTVRVVNVPLAPADLDDPAQESIIKAFASNQVTQHMRHGSLPPTGMQVDGQRVWEANFPSSSLS